MWQISVLPWLVEEAGEDGPYVREVYFVEATNAAGERFVHFKQHDVKENAWSLVAKIQKASAFSPIGSPYWNEVQPVYGSDAYVEAGGDPAFDRVTFLAVMGDHQGAELEARYQDTTG